MKTKLQSAVLMLAVSFLGLASAEAHRIQIAGGLGSTTALLFDQIVTQAGQVEGLVVEQFADSSRIFREDADSVFDCSKVGVKVACELITKHGRPLAAYETYPLGDYMDFAGDLKSNAALFATALKNAKDQDATIKAVQFSESGLRLERAEDSLKLSCVVKTDVNAESASCKFKMP